MKLNKTEKILIGVLIGVVRLISYPMNKLLKNGYYKIEQKVTIWDSNKESDDILNHLKHCGNLTSINKNFTRLDKYSDSIEPIYKLTIGEISRFRAWLFNTFN